MEILTEKMLQEELEATTLLTGEEFSSIVTGFRGLIGVETASGADETTLTQEGLAAMAKLLRVKTLGIDTKEGRRTSIVAGLLVQAGKKLLEDYRDKMEDIRLLDRGP